MKKSIEERVLLIADYIIDSKKTIRDTAKVFKISKSTIHKDMKDRLLKIDKDKYKKVKKVFNEHLETRHIKGGEATKNLYLKRKNR